MVQKTIDWNEYARCYDALGHISPYSKLQRQVVDAISPVDGQIILDAGCGTGNTTLEIMRRGKNVFVEAIDSSQAMLDIAQSKYEANNVSFRWADINLALSHIDNEKLDVIVSVNVLYALKSPEDVLKEWYRMLKYSGRLVVVTPVAELNLGLILKEHCKSTKRDAYWNFGISLEHSLNLIEEAVQDHALSAALKKVVKTNHAIVNTDTFHFLAHSQCVKMFRSSGYEIVYSNSVYSNQCLLFCLQKTGAKHV